MNRHDKETLVSLCDNKFVQDRSCKTFGSPVPGDWYYNKEIDDLIQVSDNDLIKNVNFSAERYVWLPLGFDPERCQMQIDQLLQEAGKFKDEDALGDAYHEWREHIEGDNLVQMVGNHILLKLEWLSQLLEKNKC